MNTRKPNANTSNSKEARPGEQESTCCRNNKNTCRGAEELDKRNKSSRAREKDQEQKTNSTRQKQRRKSRRAKAEKSEQSKIRGHGTK